MKTIIVPTDFSKYSSCALDFAIEFNEKIHGKIVLLHVLEFPLALFSITEEANRKAMNVYYTPDFIKGIEAKLEQWARRVKKACQVVSTKMKYGNPYQKISGTIAEEEADYIIMGSKGASGLREVFIGSNAERMVRYAECPVFVIKGQTHPQELKRIVFSSDLSEEQDSITQKAKGIQELLGLKMHVLKVITPQDNLTEESVQKKLEDFAERNRLENYTLNTIEADYSDLGIIQFSEDIHAGLIIMGTHGKTGFARLFGGSRAEDLVNESKIPVLTYRIDS